MFVDYSNWFQQAVLKSSSIISQVISVLSFTAEKLSVVVFIDQLSDNVSSIKKSP